MRVNGLQRCPRTVLGRVVFALISVLLTTSMLEAGPHRAYLSKDLETHLTLGSNAAVDVIVHGDRALVDRVAARHGIDIRKRLDRGGVLRVDKNQLERLA